MRFHFVNQIIVFVDFRARESLFSHWEREGPHSTNIIVPTKITTYPRSTRCHNISMAAYVCILCQQNTVSLKCLPLHRPRVLLRANPGTAPSPSALHLVNLNKCEPIKYSLNATPHRNLFTAWLCRPASLDKSDNANSAEITNTP